MTDFKIGNSPQPIHEQTEASSEATPVTERSATPARLKEPDFSKVMEGGLAEHLLNQRGGGPSGVNGPYGGSAEAGVQSASDWLLQQGVFPGGEGMSLKQGPMGGVVDPPNEGAPSGNTPIGVGVIFGNTPQGGATDPPPNMGPIDSGPGVLVGSGGMPPIKGQGPQGGGVFDPPNDAGSVNAPMGGNVVPFNSPGGGATDPPPNVSAQQGMDGGSNTSIPQIKFTDRPETIINLPSTSFDANFGNLGGDLPADIKAIGDAIASPSSIPSAIGNAVQSAFGSSSQQNFDPFADPIPGQSAPSSPGDYELTPYDTEGDPTTEDTGDNPPEEVV
jgi:hypothetical protein